MPVRSKHFIVLFLCSSMAVSCLGQVSVGLNFGSVRMKFSGDSPAGFGFFSPLPGFSGGLNLDYRFNEAVALSLDPSYQILRSKYSVYNDSNTRAIDSASFSLHSISLPFHVIILSENGRFYVLAGIQVDQVLAMKGKTLDSSYPETQTDYQVADFIINAQFGAGFIVPLGRPYLSFEFIYCQGLNDLSSELVHAESWLPRTKLTRMGLTIGFHYPLGNPDAFKVRKHR